MLRTHANTPTHAPHARNSINTHLRMPVCPCNRSQAHSWFLARVTKLSFPSSKNPFDSTFHEHWRGRSSLINLQRWRSCLKTVAMLPYVTFVQLPRVASLGVRRSGPDIKPDIHCDYTVPRQADPSSKVIATPPGVIHHEFCKDNAKKRNLRTNVS